MPLESRRENPGDGFGRETVLTTQIWSMGGLSLERIKRENKQLKKPHKANEIVHGKPPSRGNAVMGTQPYCKDFVETRLFVHFYVRMPALRSFSSPPIE